MRDLEKTRRGVLALTGSGLLAATAFAPAMAAAQEGKKESKGPGEEKEVGAVEDLMREHGVLRRCLLVYSETVPLLRSNPGSVVPQGLAGTAQLFRRFGEGYHEMMLEEMHIFPAVKQAGGAAADLVDVLKTQHERGRAITAYVIDVTGKGSIGTGDAEPLARALEGFVLMYRNHAAREDTVVFPAWKDALSAPQLREMGDKFEDIERQMFGHDGFEEAVKQIAAIEQSLGLADLAKFTAPPPKA
jgi:hemerythrin-like domain-containing protein